MAKITNEIFLQRLQKIHGDKITPLEDYKGGRVKPKMKFHCNVCGNDFECRADQLLSGHGCSICGKKMRAEKAKLGKKTNKQFLLDLQKIHENKYVPLEEYKNAMTKIKFHCNVCNNDFEMKPNTILNGSNCPICMRIALTESNRLTNEQFLKKLKEKNITKYVPLEKYITTVHKIKFHCNECNNDFITTPRSILAGKGCPFCKRIKSSKAHSLTTEQFMHKLYNMHGDKYTLISKYFGTAYKSTFHCNVCGNDFEMRGESILLGHGCPECGKCQCAKKNSSTNELFLMKLKMNYPDLEAITDYKTANSAIRMHCNKCNNDWTTTPKLLFSTKYGCPKCGYKRIEHEDFVNKLNLKFSGTIEPLENYVNQQTKIKFHCNICNTIWETTPYSILHATLGCPECSKKLQRKEHSTFLKEIENIHGNNITILDTYKKANVKINVRCNVCGSIFMMTPAALLSGESCPKCKMSKGEKYCEQYLNENNYIYERQYKIADCKDKLPLPFDFAVFNNNNKLLCLIEYDGAQHISANNIRSSNYDIRQQSFDYIQHHDKIKTEFCELHSIPLIRIQYKTKYNKMGNQAKQLIFEELDQKIKAIRDENTI